MAAALGRGDPHLWYRHRRLVELAAALAPVAVGFGPYGNRLYSERHEREVVQLYVEDERSLNEIENLIGVKRATVHDILKRNRVRTRPAGCGRKQPPLSSVDLVRTAWLHEQGLTYEQIGELLGLSAGGVKYRLTVARRRLGHSAFNRGRNNRPKTAVPAHVKKAIAAWARD